MSQPITIDDYIASFPEEVQEKLRALRKLIREEAPDAQEKISYQMPAYFLNGPLVFFAAFKDHISLFPTSSPIDDPIKGVGEYRTGKGTLQFPLDRPLPLPLIRKIVVYRVKENLEKKKK